jgi:tetratricopeptide (TPR) repeat protein
MSGLVLDDFLWATAECGRISVIKGLEVRVFGEPMRNEWQKAQDLYQKALQIQPDYPVAANNLGYLMLNRSGNVNVALSLA